MLEGCKKLDGIISNCSYIQGAKKEKREHWIPAKITEDCNKKAQKKLKTGKFGSWEIIDYR